MNEVFCLNLAHVLMFFCNGVERNIYKCNHIYDTTGSCIKRTWIFCNLCYQTPLKVVAVIRLSRWRRGKFLKNSALSTSMLEW